VNMSGDLQHPGRAIPRGTLAAIAVGYAIYMILPVFLAFRADADSLVREPLIMQRMALWGPAILLGVWGATLSSAVGSILGAPRVLQALRGTMDGVSDTAVAQQSPCLTLALDQFALTEGIERLPDVAPIRPHVTGGVQHLVGNTRQASIGVNELVMRGCGHLLRVTRRGGI